MGVVVFVAIFDQGLELRHIFWVCKVDNIDGYVVFFEPLAKLFELIYIFT